MKSNWWEKEAEELQNTIDMKDMKTFFTSLRKTYGPKPRGLTQPKALDGESALQGKDKIWDRFADHLDQLQRPVVSSLDEPPILDELMASIR